MTWYTHNRVGSVQLKYFQDVGISSYSGINLLFIVILNRTPCTLVSEIPFWRYLTICEKISLAVLMKLNNTFQSKKRWANAVFTVIWGIDKIVQKRIVWLVLNNNSTQTYKEKNAKQKHPKNLLCSKSVVDRPIQSVTKVAPI